VVYRGGDRRLGGRAAHDARRPALVFPLAILTALTLRAVFRLAYRQAEGLIGSIVDLLGLTPRVPDHTTLMWTAACVNRQFKHTSGSRRKIEPYVMA
jgi:Transposase DDE domain